MTAELAISNFKGKNDMQGSLPQLQQMPDYSVR
jgi:hypothetical protein